MLALVSAPRAGAQAQSQAQSQTQAQAQAQAKNSSAQKKAALNLNVQSGFFVSDRAAGDYRPPARVKQLLLDGLRSLVCGFSSGG